MKLLYSLFIILILTAALSACTGQDLNAPQATPTLKPGLSAEDVIVMMNEQNIAADMTRQANEKETIRLAALATSTQQVLDAVATQQAEAKSEQATQQSWMVTVQAAQAQETATAQAQATATQMAVTGITATVQAQATATAAHATEQAPIVAAKATALGIEIENAQLELDRAKRSQWISTWGGWIFAFVLLGVGVYVAWKRSQVGIIADENGRVRVVMVNNRALAPDLMVRPVLEFGKNAVTAPSLGVPDEVQMRVAHESKVVEAIRALPPGYNQQGVKMLAGMGSQPAVNIQVVQPEQMQGIRNELDLRLLEEDE